MVFNNRHRIAIHDEKMMEFVRSNLQMSDSVSIYGKMVYKQFMIEKRKFTRGWILARSIHKIEDPDEVQITKPKPKQPRFYTPDMSIIR